MYKFFLVIDSYWSRNNNDNNNWVIKFKYVWINKIKGWK